MLKVKIGATVLLSALLLLVGCSQQLKKPADVSDPAKSMHWISAILATNPKADVLLEVHEHAYELEAAHPGNAEVATFIETNKSTFNEIPQQVSDWAIEKTNLEAMKWALDENPDIIATNEQLKRVWKMNPQWHAIAEAHFANTLPVFMNEAVKDMNIHYFEKNAAPFKATGYAMFPPMRDQEYHLNYIHFLGVELKKATAAGDPDRINYLLDNTPTLELVSNASRADRVNMKAFADHVVYELKSEALIARLVGLGYPFESFDIEKVDLKSPLIKGIMNNPTQAVAIFGLDKGDHELTKTEIRFLARLPITKLENLHERHVEEAIEMCLAAGASQQAVQFVQLKGSQAPLEHKDYLQLMGWAVQYDDQKMLQLVKRHGGDIRIDELDLNALASDQKTFVRYAPQFLKHVSKSMEEDPTEGGITFGKIKQILANPNQDAGLYLITKLKLDDDVWDSATGGKTLLMEASEAGNLKVVKYLVEKRESDIYAATSYSTNEATLFGTGRASEGKMTAMLYAAQGGHPEVIKYLAGRGLSVNESTHYGATPLMLAATEGHLEAVNTLLKLGANPKAEMKSSYKENIYASGLTYRDLRNAALRAKAKKHLDVLDVLLDAGAVL